MSAHKESCCFCLWAVVLAIVVGGVFAQTSLQRPDFGLPDQAQSTPSAKKKSIIKFGNSVAIHIPMSRREAIFFSTEMFRFASTEAKIAEGLEQDAEWKFRSIPLRAGYEYALTDPDARLVAVVGGALSYHFSYAARRIGERNEGAVIKSVYEKDMGMGVGAEVFAGIRANVTSRLFLNAGARLSAIDGLAILSSNNGINADFQKLDFGVGVGLRL
ncbi:MAG: hypothetical protein RhofKO_29350 [Rhodothermales bacterium]